MLSFLVVGCSTPNGADGGTADGQKQFTEFCVAEGQARADFRVRCGTYTSAYATDEAASWAAMCNGPEAALGTTVTFNAQGAQSCLDNFAALTCNEVFKISCDAAITGILGQGATCFRTTECKAGLWCNVNDACPGTCQPRSAVGQPSISRYGEDCIEGSVQYGSLCVTPVAEGMPCAPTGGNATKQPCVSGWCSDDFVCTSYRLSDAGSPCTGNSCVEGALCLNGVCTAYRTADENCDADNPCQLGLLCGDAGICTPAHGVGEPCDPSLDQCTSSTFCDVAPGQSVGTCANPRELNGACAGDWQCNQTLWCSDGACVAKGATGESCSMRDVYNSCAPELYCQQIASGMPTGTCGARRSLGETCGDNECALGAYCVNGVCSRSTCRN